MIDEGGVLDMKRPALACGDPHGYRIGILGSYCERFVPGGEEFLTYLEILDYCVLGSVADGHGVMEGCIMSLCWYWGGAFIFHCGSGVESMVPILS